MSSINLPATMSSIDLPATMSSIIYLRQLIVVPSAVVCGAESSAFFFRFMVISILWTILNSSKAMCECLVHMMCPVDNSSDL